MAPDLARNDAASKHFACTDVTTYFVDLFLTILDIIEIKPEASTVDNDCNCALANN